VVSEYYRNKAKERVFAHYNGLAVVKIGGLGTSLEVEKAKKCAAMLPQTLLAVTSADGRSLVVVTCSTQPIQSIAGVRQALVAVIESYGDCEDYQVRPSPSPSQGGEQRKMPWLVIVYGSGLFGCIRIFKICKNALSPYTRSIFIL